LQRMMSRIASIQAEIADGRNPQAIIDMVRANILRHDTKLKSFVHVSAAAQAGQGPLSGVAVGLKDIIDTSDMPTGMGSSIYAGWQPKANAALAMLLRKAGATIVGKTATTAFAFLDPAPTLNPHHADVTPGGSSSGSAAAVAAGLVPLAFGTQTGGSIIRPAAFCGIAAIKPSFGILPTIGIKCFSWSLDTPGLFARSVTDLSIALEAMTGRREMRHSNPPQRLRIGIVRQHFAGDADSISETALLESAKVLRDAGHDVRDIETPESFASAFAAHGTIQNYEAVQALAWEWANHQDALPPRLKSLLQDAQDITAAEYDIARKASRRARDGARVFFSDVDAILTYATVGEAPSRATTGDPKFNRLWTLLGSPCATVPVCKGQAGLPVGVQIVARFGQDNTVLAIAQALEDGLSC
jgi:Asp-tRNA(Asn)/Glu-tRNA(Gln) amidotransferase A subunit family amidase